MANGERKFCILIADDDDDDLLMMRSAFEDIGFNGHIMTVGNGEQLMSYLFGDGSFADSPFPDLILLDLNMPKKDGRESLRLIKKHQKFMRTPVVVYSTSNNPDDVRFCYDHGANSFITKPSSYEKLRAIAEVLRTYWIETVVRTR